MSERPIQFWFRGAIRQVEGAAPARSLLDWLREDMHATGYYQAGCDECAARHIARMPRRHRVAGYVAERTGDDVTALQQAVRKQYEIDA